MHETEFTAGIPFGPATERAREILLEKDRQLLRSIREQGGMENYVESSEQKKPAKVEGEAEEAKNKLAE